jgi:Tol biopolymer transport system component
VKEVKIMNIKITNKISTPVLAILALIVFGLGVTFAQTPPLRANGKIAFASTRDGIWEIYSMNSDGSAQRRLTYSTEDGAFLPSWSPNGRKIAYLNITNILDPYYHLKVMNADGSNQTTLTTVFYSGTRYALSWSPDGTKIAFNSAGDIHAINVDGSNLVNLTNHPAHDGEPSWSPDGSQIAFTSNRTTLPYGIHIMNADGSNVQQYGTGNFSFAPKWSPDGERLLFLTDNQDGFDYDLLSANISGSTLNFLAFGVYSAAWSPDGTKIVLTGANLSGGIFTINATGGGIIQIGPADTSGPDWQPLPRKIAADFDGDGRSDISVFRPSNRTWYLNQSTAGFSATQFGLATDKVTPADFDGDGKADIAVFRDGVWYRLNSSNGTVGIVQFGIVGDIPQSADFTGDGRAEIAVYRNGIWWTLDLTNNQVNVTQFGNSTYKPVVGDYDSDGRADQAIYRDGVWHLNRSTQGYTVINFGLATDKLVPADYDGDGKTDQAVYRDGTWYVLQSSQGFTAFQFGLSSDIPVPADYDGDGRTDIAVYRDGTWYIIQSSNGSISYQQFGLSSDIPVAANSQ